MQLKLEKNGGKLMKIDDIIKEEMTNPEFAQYYNEYSEQLESALALSNTRKELGLTQVDLAKMSGVPQSTIARIERGDNVTFGKLSQIAHAMGKTLRIEFV